MGRRAWAITALLGLVAAACGITAVVATQNRADAEQRQEAAEQQLLDHASDLGSLQTEVDSQAATQAELDSRVDTLATMFTPDVLGAVVQVQADAVPAACASARTATRDAVALTTGDSVMVFAVASAPAAHPVLDGLPQRWGRMLDPTAVQAEIDRCAADEAAIIEAERQAAAAAAAAETPIGYSECIAAVPGASGACLDLDGDGYAGYPDEGLLPTPWGQTPP